MDTFVPHTSTRKRHNLPWITPEVRRSIRKKQRRYNKARKSGSPADRHAYKQQKRLTQKLIRQAHDTHVALEHSLSTKDTKPFWRYVKSKRQDNTGISPLKRVGHLISDSTEQAKILNSQFRSVFTQVDLQNLPTMTGTPHYEAADIDIQVTGVEKLLQNLNPGKASGPDAIPNRHSVAPQSLHLCLLPSLGSL